MNLGLFQSGTIMPQVWERIQICKRAARFDARLIGCIKGVSLLVTEPVERGRRIDFFEGESVEVRMFSGTDIYAFESTIERICVAPVHYLHLSYPRRTRIQPLRRSPWVRLSLPGIVHCREGARKLALITNLSEDGAQLDAPSALGAENDQLRVSFQIELDDMKRGFGLDARIMHAGSAEEGMMKYGIAFIALSEEDKVWLKCMVFQRIATGRLV
jgi:hypothetical protein